MTQRLQAEWFELQERKEPDERPVDWAMVKRDGRWRKAIRWLTGEAGERPRAVRVPVR